MQPKNIIISFDVHAPYGKKCRIDLLVGQVIILDKNGNKSMAPHPVDVHVGKRLRSRRTILGMSQEELGEAVGVTFQQVQKYERGLNRIGSSRLYEFSCILGVSVGHFFEDFEEGQKAGDAFSFAEDGVSFEYERMNNKEVLTLVRAYYGISDHQVRKKILALIKSLSSSDGLEEEVLEGGDKKVVTTTA